MVEVVLGDNPLFGVSHSGKTIRNENVDVARLLSETIRIGVTEWMVTPHAAAYTALHELHNDKSEIAKGLEVYLVFPYPHAWNEIVASSGYLGLIKILPKWQMFLAITKSVPSILGRNKLLLVVHLFEALVEQEINKIRALDIKIKGICVHNILVDMLIAAGRTDVLAALIKRLNAKNLSPILLTQNISTLIGSDLPDETIICGSFNNLGYMVNPSLEEAIQAVKSSQYKLWAMQVAASGYSSVTEFQKFCIENQLTFEKIVLGTSKVSRILEAKQILENGKP